jgi:hypothetical protein
LERINSLRAGGNNSEIILDRIWGIVVTATSESRRALGGVHGTDSRVVGPSKEKEGLNEVDGSREVVQRQQRLWFY